MTIEQEQQRIAKEWISSFREYLAAATHRPDLNHILLHDIAWRDQLTFEWNFHSKYGINCVHEYLTDAQGQNKLLTNEFKCLDSISEVKEVQAGPGFSWIQGVFDFETKVGIGKGVVRLMLDPQSNTWKAKTIYTGLVGLKGIDEPVFSKRPYGYVDGPLVNRQTWKDAREVDAKFESREPEILIIGSGHSGLMLGVRLKMLGVDALIIDKNERVGDNWRKRYNSLKLHDPVWMDHMPYMPFPESWPIFPPKDKMGDWLEIYANALELNVWTSTILDEHAKYDDANKIWTITVATCDKKLCTDGKPVKRVVKPKHLVLATGHSGDPRIPRFKNEDNFMGKIMHSSDYKSGKEFQGKKVAVVGAGTSAIDIVQDLYEQGAQPTIVQRSSTYVVSTSTFLSAQISGMYPDPSQLPTQGDLIAFTTPPFFARPLAQGLTAYMAQLDQALLEGLNKAGFKTDLGVNDLGIGGDYLVKGGGYYIDVGGCELIINGNIKVKQGSEIIAYSTKGLEFSDGTSLGADAVVLATGWDDFLPYAEKVIGSEARRMGPVWGPDEEGDIRGNWRPTQHPALWNMLGPMSLSRFYSIRLALQLKARLAGIIPSSSI